MSDGIRIEDKTPWDFVYDWYSVEEIARSIQRMKCRRMGWLKDDGLGGDEIPMDVESPQFAEWLADQYRLAMHKGIQIGWQARERAQENQAPSGSEAESSRHTAQ